MPENPPLNDTIQCRTHVVLERDGRAPDRSDGQQQEANDLRELHQGKSGDNDLQGKPDLKLSFYFAECPVEAIAAQNYPVQLRLFDVGPGLGQQSLPGPDDEQPGLRWQRQRGDEARNARDRRECPQSAVLSLPHSVQSNLALSPQWYIGKLPRHCLVV